MERNDPSEKQISAVSRTMNVLEVLSRQSSINLEQLSNKTKLPKATLLRFLISLSNLGYVYRDPYDHYSLSMKMFVIGSRNIEHTDIYKIARPVAENLAQDLGETVHMGIREDNSALYVLNIESQFNIRMHSRIGHAIPLYCTAIGKMLLSGLKKAEQKTLINTIPLTPYTAHTIQSKSTLMGELETVKTNGWAMDEKNMKKELCVLQHQYTTIPGRWLLL